MKTLNPLTTSRLRVLEFGQLSKTTLANLALLPAGTITDTVLLAYIANMQTKSNDYDEAMLHIAKSDETSKITEADQKRDNAIYAFLRLLSVYELSESDTELEAYASLNNLMNTYSGIDRMNYEQESNAIDNLLAEFALPKYATHISTLQLSDYVSRLQTKNTDFKTIFNVRVQETASKVDYDVKALRSDLQTTYGASIQYILAMANAVNTDQYNKSLDIVNTVRTYYHDLVARRQGGNDEAIPPMP